MIPSAWFLCVSLPSVNVILVLLCLNRSYPSLQAELKFSLNHYIRGLILRDIVKIRVYDPVVYLNDPMFTSIALQTRGLLL